MRVLVLPFELHPEIPAEGRDRGASRAGLYATIAAECDDAGLPFSPPTHIPNTRRALETAEWVRVNEPGAFPTLHEALFRAHFADGVDIGDRGVLNDLVTAAGADASASSAAVDDGATRAPVDESMRAALEAGVTGTPAWLIRNFLIPGVQPRQFFERIVSRLAR